jgi:integrase
MGKRGEGTLFLRGKTYWHKVKVNGREVCSSTKCTTEREAREWVKANVLPIATARTDDEVHERVRAVKLSAARVTFSDALAIYQRTPHKRSADAKRAASIVSYWGDFSEWAEAQGLSHLAQITKDHAASYLARLSESGRFREARPGLAPTPVSADTRNLTLKAVADSSLDAAALKLNPFDLPKVKKDTEERDAFTIEELRAILEAVEDRPKLRALVIIAACTGLRTGDACLLQWEEVDLRGPVGFLRKKTSKTGKTVSVPIMPKLRQLLEELRATDQTTADTHRKAPIGQGNLYLRGKTYWHKIKIHGKETRQSTGCTKLNDAEAWRQARYPANEAREIIKTDNLSFVCPALASQYIDNPSKISRDFSAVLDRLGIEREKKVAGRSRPHVFKDLHSFRHSFVYLAAESGIPLAVVQGIVGHASQRMTELYANHATDKAKMEAVKRLPDFFGTATDADEEAIDAEIIPPAEVKAKEAAAMLRKAIKGKDWEAVKQALKHLT